MEPKHSRAKDGAPSEMIEMPMQVLPEDAILRCLKNNPTLDELLYQTAKACISEASPAADPAWVDMAARYRVFGEAAGITGKMAQSCQAILRDVDASLAARLSHRATAVLS
ncbi:hypothetical protein [Methylobacterium radiotolerans]|uniref:hypothetical protein n=1 Tax=Methylobacterium radiotolerans TaxID=31998 RepID=UPI00118FDF09|nr:hypothetical protein [Methylobacterium radiotolerans]GEN01768.1 hypothetical protein MRA01_63070 [Methylobacterium radiotolerans]